MKRPRDFLIVIGFVGALAVLAAIAVISYRSAGAAAYFHKPADMSELVATIRQHLGGS